MKHETSIPCAKVTPTGVVHRLEVGAARTECGKGMDGETIYGRARDAVKGEGRRPCRSCFRGHRAAHGSRLA